MPDEVVKSRRELILERIVSRLEAISLSHDTIAFATDAGQAVFLGEMPGFGPDDPPYAIVVTVGDDEVAYEGEAFLIQMPIGVQAVVPADLAKPYMASEAVAADIKRAIELPDDVDGGRTLGGLLAWHGLERGSTRVLQREPGSTFVGSEVQYGAPYREGHGHP